MKKQKLLDTLIKNEDLMIDGLILAHREQLGDFYKNRHEAMGNMVEADLIWATRDYLCHSNPEDYLKDLRKGLVRNIKDTIKSLAVLDKTIESETYWKYEEDLKRVKEKNDVDDGTERDSEVKYYKSNTGECEEANQEDA